MSAAILGADDVFSLEKLRSVMLGLKASVRFPCGWVVKPGHARLIREAVMPAVPSADAYAGLFGTPLFEKEQRADSYEFFDRDLMHRYLAGHVPELCLAFCWNRLLAQPCSPTNKKAS